MINIEGFKLSAEHEQDLINLDTPLKVLENDLKNAHEVGLDVSEHIKDVERLRKQRDGLLRKFGRRQS